MSERKYKCPFCNLRDTKLRLINHVEKKHEHLIPEGYTAARTVFNGMHNIENGKCVVCGNPTEWNEKTYKYKRLCNNPKCRDTLRNRYKDNMISVYGKTTLLNDADYQAKMLANRSISGTYTWSDNKKFTYTGQYEKNALEFMDSILHCNSEDIIAPGPVIDYKDKDGTHRKWITDIFYIPYNLIIEVKDGGNNPNNREMPEYRAKQISKETALYNFGEYNYLRLTDNQFGQLLEVFALLKEKMILDSKDKRVFKVNEHMGVAGVPSTGVARNSTVFIQYNMLQGEVIDDAWAFGVTDDITSTKMRVKDDQDKTTIVDKLPFLRNRFFKMYKFKGSKYLPSKYVSEHVEEATTLYEEYTGRKLLTKDQYLFDEDFEEIRLNPKDEFGLIDSLVSIDLSKNKDLPVDYLPLTSISEINQAKCKLLDFNESTVIMEDSNGYFAIDLNDKVRTRSYKNIYEIDSNSFIDAKDILTTKRIDVINSDGMYYVLKQNYSSKKELEDDYSRTLSMTDDFRSHSNDMSISIYGKSNDDRYAELIGKYLNTQLKDKPLNIIESTAELTDIEIERAKDFGISIHNKDLEVKMLKNWTLNSGIPIMLPIYETREELELAYNVLNQMNRELIRKSDNELFRVFGCDNDTMYDFLLSVFNNRFDDTESDFTVPLIESVFLKDDISSKDVVIPNDVPYYMPEEIERFIDDGVFNTLTKEDRQESKQWLREYKKLFNNGSYSAQFVQEWVDKVRDLSFKLSNDCGNTVLMQKLLEYGWYPYAEFIESNRKIAHDRLVKVYHDSKINRSLRESKLPFEFDTKGNIYINKAGNLDYNSEYAKCHKLLVNYEKVGNTEGMKTELAKLYYLNNKIETSLFTYNQVLNKDDRAKLVNSRARILNDFNKYIKVVLKKDRNFNFTNYFAKSEYNTDVLVIKKPTLDMTIDKLGRLLRRIAGLNI